MYIKISKMYESLLKFHGNENIAIRNNSKQKISLTFIYIYIIIKTF